METDPSKRYTSEQIKAHPWYKLAKPICKNEGLIIGKNEIPIEPSLLGHLEKFGFKRDYATTCLNRNKHNQVTTVYYLLHKRFEMEGKLASCFKVKSTPVKDKKAEKVADYEASPDVKQSLKKKLFQQTDGLTKISDYDAKEFNMAKADRDKGGLRGPKGELVAREVRDSKGGKGQRREDNLSDLIGSANDATDEMGSGISPQKFNRGKRRDRTEEDPE